MSSAPSSSLEPLSLFHVHWEGSVRLATLQKIARRKGIALPNPNIYHFDGFEEFQNIFPVIFQPLVEEDDFYELTKAFVEDLQRDGVDYCETFFVPLAHLRRGIPLNRFLPPILTALEEGEKQYGVRVNLIYSILRMGGNTDWGHQTLDLYEQCPDTRIVGIDLSGQETPGTIEPFVSVFQRVRSLGLHSTAHAGEFGGPAQVWETIDRLKVDRIGHGISVIQDQQLMLELIDRPIPLEICPSSNILLKAVPSLTEHPIRQLFEQGVPLLIGTDDPAFFDNSLSGEYALLQSHFGFNEVEIAQLIANGKKYRFDEKAAVWS